MTAAVFVPAMLVTGLAVDWRLGFWLLPLHDPPSNTWGSLALSAIWYLRDYLWFVLVSPLALPVFRRFPVPLVLAQLALLVAIQLGLPAGNHIVQDFALYFGAWLLGFAHHDGLLRRMSRPLLLGLSGLCAGLGAAWFLTHPGVRGYDLNDIRLGDGLWSTAFILIVLGFAPAAARWVDRLPSVGRAITVLNSRAMTIYLWHVPVVVGTATVLARLGMWRQDLFGSALRLAVVVPLITLVVLAFGWVEDVASRRRPVLVPGARRTPARAPEVESRPVPVDVR